jgi:uncharacterized protein YjbJ (UPF0337 family)
MGIMDKITGRAKQAAGDITGDERLREEGLNEERKGDAKQEAEKADQLRREAAQLETGRSEGTGTGTGTDADRV